MKIYSLLRVISIGWEKQKIILEFIRQNQATSPKARNDASVRILPKIKTNARKKSKATPSRPIRARHAAAHGLEGPPEGVNRIKTG